MNRQFKSGLSRKTLLAALTFLAGATGTTQAGTISQIPLFLTTAVDARVMLLLSRDHQLSVKAYTDYTDLSGDGTIDTTYNDAVTYYGYFGNNTCYTYTNNRFEPAAAASGTNSHHCSSKWSGNFLNWATMTRMDVLRKVLYGGFRRSDSTTETVLERALLPFDAHAFAKVFKTATEADMLKYTPYSKTVLSFCNLTDASGVSATVDASANPPLLRVAWDNGPGTTGWPYWSASEKPECTWGGPNTHPATSKRLSPSGAGDNSSTDGLYVRVKACVSGYEEASCASYPGSTVKKPTGLLQTYGMAGRPIQFGLMTGSYKKNKSGGVLRRNVSRISGNATASKNEVNTNTGVFLNQGSSDAGIINTLNRLRIASFDYSSTSGAYYQNGCDKPVVATFADDQCIDWGNPLGEMYLEAMRYFAGKTTANFGADDSAYVPSLPQVSWVDPTPAAEWCAGNSVVTISTGLNSFDADQLSNDLSINADSLVNLMGDASHENLNGGTYLIGENGADTDQLCTDKSVDQLSQALGICPEVPHWKGAYHVGGLAHYAHTHDLRSDRSGTQSLTSYAISLAESLPKFNIPVGSGTVTLLPACQGNDNNDAGTGPWRSCALVDVAVESLSYTAGKISSGSLVVNWDASQWGNDYDMDATERLQFCVGAACSPAVSSNQIKVTTSLFQTAMGRAVRIGYTITGTTEDAAFFPVRRNGGGAGGSDFTSYPTTPPCNGTVPCPPTGSKTFTQGTATAKSLENPLWYAAKYGAFGEIDTAGDGDITNDKPNQLDEWDAKDASGNRDGVPDGYFKATNPAKLEQALDNIFGDVAKKSSSAAAISTNSTRLDTNTMIFQAKFNSGDWSGHLLAFAFANGAVGAQKWDAADSFSSASFSYASRKVFTLNTNPSPPTKGVAFTWDSLSTAQQTALNTLQGTNDGNGQARLNYLRGAITGEKRKGGSFRNREYLLGDIINSDPWFVGMEDYGYSILPGAEGSSYITFRQSGSYLSRTKMIYIGANDGMLHGFDADPGHSGVEKLAYVPNSIIGGLSLLTSPNYDPGAQNPIQHTYLVDGSPRAADAYVDPAGGASKQWRTILVGSTGAGGRSVFALDITNPGSFGAGNVLWEFSNTNDSDLGYTLPQASVIRMNNGSWGTIVGNGYNSDNGHAVLFILDAGTGAVIKKIDTGVGGNLAISKNGLSTPVAVDVNNDRIADYVYAGDLAGNLWKFDISSGSASGWAIAGSAPLFTACVPATPGCAAASNATNDAARQPITAKPQVGRVGPDQSGGVMVYFGTGKYFETGDNSVGGSPQMQTFYGIWDNGSAVSSRSSLQQQTITYEGTGTNAAGYVVADKIRTLSKNAVSYPTKRGWYLDLKTPSATNGGGERVVSAPLLVGSRLVFVTLIPDDNMCGYGGTSWLMELEAISGQNLSQSALDLLGSGGAGPDGHVDSNDTVNGGNAVSGVQSHIGIIKTPTIVGDEGGSGGLDRKVAGGTRSDEDKTVWGESADRGPGRQSWVQIR
ncbi:pilus assembly protein [Methylomagnum sp.]